MLIQPLKLYSDPFSTKERALSTSFFSSLLLHISVLFILARVPFLFFMGQDSNPNQERQIVYEFQEIKLPDLPELKPTGPGGTPGKGTDPQKAAAKGSTLRHPKLTLVSNPPHPDNFQQTIIQPNSPPNVKITMNLRLPNVILGGVLPVTTPAPPTPPPPMKLSVPSTLNSLTVPEATVVSTKPPDLVIPASATPDMPALPTPPPPAPPKPQAPPPIQPVQLATLGIEAAANGAASRLLVLSVDPAPPSDKISLPAGNRYGAFSISPGGNQPGSPSGVAGGSAEGGEGGPGHGGDASTGVGSGKEGGGGGGKTGSLVASTSGLGGSAGSGNGAGTLSAAAIEKLIYPILRPPPVNRFAMVVTAGPEGGGGLHVFGVLTGGKVYTVFLQMPQRNWILQYCATKQDAGGSPSPQQSHRVVVQLSFGLIPPSVEKRFDFHRPKLPPEKQKDMIVLHGIIDKDGSVQNLQVYQSVQALSDQAALLAFKRWKFRPALKDGKPIPVEILVGIPAT